MRPAAPTSLLGCLAACLVALPARAHIDLLEPEPRAHGTAAFGDTEIDDNSNLKSAPCGQMINGRTERVATYAPGETIVVRVREENAHVSYLRVALDLDGDEFPLRGEFPGGPETQEQAEAAEAALGVPELLLVYREENDTAGFVHELEVTLPEQSCEACTLQVLQYMYDDPGAPYYFQCADLVIAEPSPAFDAGAPGADAGQSAGADRDASAGADPAGPAPARPGGANQPRPARGSAPTSEGQPPAATASPSEAPGTGEEPPRAARTSESSGSCAAGARPAGAAGGAWMSLALLGLAARRRRRLARSASGPARPKRIARSRRALLPAPVATRPQAAFERPRRPGNPD